MIKKVVKHAFLILIAVLVGALAVWYAIDPSTVGTGLSVAFTVIVGGCAWVINRVTTQFRSGVLKQDSERDATGVTDKSADALQSSLRDVGHSTHKLGGAIEEESRLLSEVGGGIRLSARELEKLDEEIRNAGIVAQESADNIRNTGDQIQSGRRELAGVIDILARGKK